MSDVSTTTRPAIDGRHMTAIERWTMILAAVVIAGAFFTLSRRMLLGVTLGSSLMVLNAYVLRRLTARVLSTFKRPGLAILVFNLKMAAMIGVVFVAVRYLPIDPMGFLIGISVFPVAVVIAAVRMSKGKA